MPEQGVELESYIKGLRRSLMAAMEEGDGQALRFKAEEIILELQIGATTKTKGNGGIKFEVFGIGFNAGGGQEKGGSNTQKLTLKLKPVSADGGNILIADEVVLD